MSQLWQPMQRPNVNYIDLLFTIFTAVVFHRTYVTLESRSDGIDVRW